MAALFPYLVELCCHLKTFVLFSFILKTEKPILIVIKKGNWEEDEGSCC